MSRTPSDIPRRVEQSPDGKFKRITLEPGLLVFCDDCGADYTDRTESGGLLFQSKALCPMCSPKWEKDAKRYQEEHFIRARCPEGVSFADWVRDTLR